MHIRASQCNPWRECWEEVLGGDIKATDIVGIILFSQLNRLDLDSEEPNIVTWHDRQGNSSFVDSDFPDKWKIAIENIRERFGAHRLPWAK